MENGSVIGMILALFTSLVSYKALRDREFFEAYLFDVDRILIDRDYKRLISSGFLHISWFHLLFNMIALLSFSDEMEFQFGAGRFLILYFASMVGGNLFALYVHRQHGDYRAAGASGAISGIIMAFIVLFPSAKISFILIPVEFPAWLMGVAFVGVSIFGIKSQLGNIGHEAHLGGAVIGVLLTILMRPDVLQQNLWIILAILIPSIAFIWLIVRNPSVLLIDRYWGEGFEGIKRKVKDIQQPPPPKYYSKEEELDELLDKIRRKGVDSLSSKEKKRLDELSGH